MYMVIVSEGSVHFNDFFNSKTIFFVCYARNLEHIEA